MALDCSCGFSFLLARHLWVVVKELPGPPEEVIIVNLNTKRQHSDTTVVLKSGDHPFIKHDTVVTYSDARLFSKDDLRKRIELRLFEPRQYFSKDILKIIQQGLIDSPYTPKEFK